MIAITGPTGKLGRHVLAGLLKKLPATEIIALARNPQKAAEIEALGIQVRAFDYENPEAAALAGVDKLLLISSNEIGKRIAQHTAVIDVAGKAGVKLLAYTSLLHADTSSLIIAPEHRATEHALLASGIPYVLLRNGWYFENQTEALAPAVEHGAVLGTAGSGRFASATRADYADAAVAVLTTEGHANQTYELAGDASYDLPELAATVSTIAGKPVVYNHLPPEAYKNILLSFHLPPEVADIVVDGDLGAAHNQLTDDSHTLSHLIGRPTTTLNEAVRQALR